LEQRFKMTSFVTLILVLSLTSSAVLCVPWGDRNSTTSGEDEENEIEMTEGEADETMGATDYIEAANGRNAWYRGGPQIAHGDVAMPGATSNRNASPCTARGCTWPMGSRGFVMVPITISARYNSKERNMIIRSLVEFHSVSCIRFVWMRASHRDYIDISPANGCWSYLGRQGGRQMISLQQRGCVFRQVIQHELLHALGFHHEQARSDRDDHVRIMAQNVMSGRLHNFDKVDTNNLGTPYDYGSIMHYGRYAFSKERGVLPTIVPIPDPTAVIGKATMMSANDIERINVLYRCSAS